MLLLEALLGVAVVVVLRVFLASISALLGQPLLALTISVGPIGSGFGSGLGSRYACSKMFLNLPCSEICQFQASCKRDNMFTFKILVPVKTTTNRWLPFDIIENAFRIA